MVFFRIGIVERFGVYSVRNIYVKFYRVFVFIGVGVFVIIEIFKILKFNIVKKFAEKSIIS